MSLVILIEGREAISVRAALLATHGNVTPLALSLELSEPDAARRIAAHTYRDGKVVPVRSDAWEVPREILSNIARRYKLQEPERGNPEQDLHQETVWRESLKVLPAGTFVWLDEFERWYRDDFEPSYSTRVRYSRHSVFEEIAREIGEDDDREPQYQLTGPVSLDLNPNWLTDMLTMIQAGFEKELETMTVSHEARLGPGKQVSSDEDLPQAKMVQTEQNAPAETPWHLLATPAELIATFGTFTNMSRKWFNNAKDTPKLKAALHTAGIGGRKGREPLYFVFPVMQWLINPKRRKGSPMDEATGWRLLKNQFPKVYEVFKDQEPDPD